MVSTAITTGFLLLLCAARGETTNGSSDQAKAADRASLDKMVEADWNAQENRRGRTPESPAAIRQALGRLDRLLDYLRSRSSRLDVGSESAEWIGIRERVGRLESIDRQGRLALYRRIRTLARKSLYEIHCWPIGRWCS